MSGHDSSGRRAFLVAGTALLGTSALGAFTVRGAEFSKYVEDDEGVTPAEDLMREHGVLKRVLLIYDEVGARLRDGREYPPAVLAGASGIIREFIENYHEKLEEDHLFPRFEKAGELRDLVTELRVQHQRGRLLTERISGVAARGTHADPGERKSLAESLRLFTRMYAVHEAREDTVLFPALRRLMSGSEYEDLGEQFEKKEHELFGEDGFERYVEKVAGLEKSLGIYELSAFTPRP